MVDGALETLDLTLSKRGIVGFTLGFFVDDSDSFSFFHFLNFSKIFLEEGCGCGIDMVDGVYHIKTHLYLQKTSFLGVFETEHFLSKNTFF